MTNIQHSVRNDGCRSSCSGLICRPPYGRRHCDNCDRNLDVFACCVVKETIMTADWDEIKRLAADFQRAQLSSTLQRLSERNCVELITKLIEDKLLDVVFTLDGKEYITPQQLSKEIEDELYVHGGRIDVVDLSKILNVDLNHITSAINQISSRNIKLVLGQLLHKTYINHLIQDINEKLSQQGQITVAELTRHYDLHPEFLLSTIVQNLGKAIRGKQDTTDQQVFYTDAFIHRNKACLRGALMAATCPTTVAHLLAQSGVQERIFPTIIENLLERKQVPGVITGNLSGNSLYIPSVYSKTQSDWINNFYRQNGYLEYDSLSRLGIGDPVSFVRRHFQNEKLLYLKSCAVGEQLVNQVEAAIEEAVATSTILDVMTHLPSMFEPEDCSRTLNEVLKNMKTKNPVQNIQVFCDTYVVPDQFLQSLKKPFDDIIKKKAQEAVSSGAYLSAQAESKIHGGKINMDQEDVNSKLYKKEERRKKATGGKGGGGTQGRETKTKSTKKKYMRGKANEDDWYSDDDCDSSAASGSKASKQLGGKLELLTLTEVQDILEVNEVFQDEGCPELVEEITKHIYPILNKTAIAEAKVIFESTMASTVQTRRKTHSELQEKLNALVSNVRLFDKGIKAFSDNELQQQFSKYLLKSLCTDITNDVFSYIAQENMIQFDQTKEMSPEIRLKIINEVPNDAKDPLAKLHKSLSGSSVDNFLSCLEASIGPGLCDMILRKQDKRKDRPQIYAHRQSLLEQLSVAQDPAVVLHVATLLLFQTITQNILHASGRFVSNILSFLQPQLPADMFNSLQQYHDMVLKLLKTDADNSDHVSLVTSLQDGMAGIKELATTFKKPSLSDKS